MCRNDDIAVDHRGRPGIGRLARSLAVVVVLSALTAAAAIVADLADTVAAGTATGASPEDAGASCWEIKQLNPASTDGVYWLRTTSLVRPEQFYCDMTTDGGGWVLIGRGREGWTFKDYGQSTAKRLRQTVTGPDAFSPAALPGETIDALLDGGRVADLTDGLRLRRAADKAGSNWQELRWVFEDLGAWSWGIGGGHRLAAYTIDGVAGTGSNTKDSSLEMWGEPGAGNRTGRDRNGWFTFPWSGHGRQAGFSYRGGVDGERNATSYLWEYNTENQAIPFTQMFIRPRVMSAPMPPIADAGLPAHAVASGLDDRPAELAGGVVGVLKAGDSEAQLDTPVLAITTLGDRVYIGGKFSDARDTASGKLVRQSYLAAFDRTTGAWISTFRPALDGTVWDLDVAAGRLIVAGQFTNVSGDGNSSGLVALDPISGAVDSTWRASLTVAGTNTRPVARAIDVDGEWIYLGGNFTTVAGPSGSLAVGRLARVSVANGAPDPRFRPNVDGIPYDVDAAGGRVQIAGYFSGIDGNQRRGVGTLNAADGSVVGGLTDPVWTTSDVSRRYQQAVLAVGDNVWQGGSEHNVHIYRSADYGLTKAYLAENQGGDTQAFALNGDDVMQGSHANAWMYHDATFRDGLTGYTRADVYNWIGAFDAATLEYDRTFVPGLRSAYSEGAWALHTDADGCLWFGGDFLGGPFVNGQRQYLEGFSKFCGKDVTAPTVPEGAVATLRSAGGISLKWAASTDDRAGYIGYEVLRNDRVISPLVYGTSYVDATGSTGDRYFVRALDSSGNRSSTTTVLVASDNSKPTVPKNLAATVLADLSVDLTWTASTDNVGVTNYRVLRNGVELALVAGDQTSTNLTGLTRGVHWLQLQAIDATGNESAKTASARIELDGADVAAPSVPTGLQAVPDLSTVKVTASWTSSTDDVGVTAYALYRNGTFVSTVPATAISAVLDLGFGDHYIQVAARDAAGNESAKTESVLASLPAPDTSPPSVATDLTAVFDPVLRVVTISWTASTDPSGVDVYRVTRNGEFLTTAPGTQTSINVVLGAGSHYLQVSAVDPFGNGSAQTASVLVEVPPPAVADTSNPSTPRDLTATVRADGGIDVSWSASRDNVGVTSYVVTRNAVEVSRVPGDITATTLSGLGTGDHYIQVQAFDGAGNASHRTASVKVTVVAPASADTSNPSTPRDLVTSARPDGSVDAMWSASRDNVGVASYRVTRNGVEVAVVLAPATTVNIAGLGVGTHYIQVQAYDAAGNTSYRTPSSVITL